YSPFDLIICDAPCTGSGTWSRTPEQLYFFKEEKIEYYAGLQKKIAVNAIKALKKGGHLLYITCSVFKKENENIVEYLQQNTSLQLKSMRYFKGYDKQADTLFTALFTL
ncbi:MAG: Fmu (Sun) domain-containing protein, partial [Chitinophagaceae bacterium]